MGSLYLILILSDIADADAYDHDSKYHTYQSHIDADKFFP